MHPRCHLRKHLYGAICEVAHEERLIREKQDKREAYKFQECAHLTLLIVVQSALKKEAAIRGGFYDVKGQWSNGETT
jgi:hypothetical protein